LRLSITSLRSWNKSWKDSNHEDCRGFISIDCICHPWQLDLLPQIFAEIHIPQAVGDEISAPGKPHARRLKEFSEGKIIAVQNRLAVNVLANEIDLGEAETIACALENGIDNVLIDDTKGRKAAQRNNLHAIGTIGVLLQAKKLGHVEAIKPSLDKLISEKIRNGKIRIFNSTLGGKP